MGLTATFMAAATCVPGQAEAPTVPSYMMAGQGISDAFNKQSCVMIANPSGHSEPERMLRGYIDQARQSQTGREIFDMMGDEGVRICFKPELAKASVCNSVTVGNYVGNTIGLNPNYRDEPERLISTAVHEGRHQMQDDIPVSWYESGNYKEAERVIMLWITEADARMATIVFAYEMEQAGHPEYMQGLRDRGWYAHMVEAFETSLLQDPGNMPEAMRAAMRAFRDQPGLVRYYDNKLANWVDARSSRAFDPAKPERILLTDEVLRQLGEFSRYGNYMDDELMEFIRDSFTDQDYQALSNARAQQRLQNNTGQSAPTCSS